MKNKSENTDYMLGPNLVGGYSIIAHQREWVKGDGYCCFHIYENAVSDGDGTPSSYDEDFILIDEKDFKEAMFRFRKIGKDLNTFGKEKSHDRNSPFQPGDCFFDGGWFTRIEILMPNLKDSVVTSFGSDSYLLDVDTDREILQHIYYEEGIEELIKSARLISEEDFHKALKMAKDAIRDITEYLEALYKQKKKQ